MTPLARATALSAVFAPAAAFGMTVFCIFGASPLRQRAVCAAPLVSVAGALSECVCAGVAWLDALVLCECATGQNHSENSI